MKLKCEAPSHQSHKLKLARKYFMVRIIKNEVFVIYDKCGITCGTVWIGLVWYDIKKC